MGWAVGQPGAQLLTSDGLAVNLSSTRSLAAKVKEM